MYTSFKYVYVLCCMLYASTLPACVRYASSGHMHASSGHMHAAASAVCCMPLLYLHVLCMPIVEAPACMCQLEACSMVECSSRIHV